MALELQQIQEQLQEVLERVAQLERQLEASDQPGSKWKYLVVRPHPWREQLCIKGRNMTVGQLVSTVKANGLTVAEASDDLDLPAEAIEEALRYYDQDRELIELEAAEERRRLAEKGYALEPKDLSR